MNIRFNKFLSLVIILSLGFKAINSEDQGLSYDSDNLTLTEIKNCSNERSVEDFPEDFFTTDQLQHGAALLHTLFGFYCFLLTAYVCNDYLLPALDIICAELKISADVAGATFLATASCFPELFVNVVGTFLTESDLGVGTVVGGAVFNTFATPAFGALSAAQGIQLDGWILSRDCIIYIISVSVLVIVMWDARVTWYEAMILMILFTAYFALLFLNKFVIKFSKNVKEYFSKNSSLAVKTESKINKEMLNGSYKPFVHGEMKIEYRKSIQITRKKEVENGICNADAIEKLEEYIEPDTPFVWPSGSFLKKFWFLLTWPAKLILFVTIPDTRYKKFHKWYPITFIMCIMWIAISSYLVSWMMTVVGDTLGISDSIMGITLLSAGGNMPELVSIVILSRQGNGDMAMSNTLGANTLDILLCLGLPWMIKTIMTGSDVVIESGAIAYSVMSIIVCVVGFFGVTAFYKYQLNRKVGYACLVMYVLFLTFAILMETDIIFSTSRCITNDNML
ncbi:sodium/potassium/calcium exchanger 4-like [Cotesia glomerata]|uniref:Sodium/calcium exchanger membrane region domain-containing protein n=1 Tax=Cotesia glomerata TaxID=32391 RepID=A0AAV7HWU3_COTGL|nr:sodium/potassium/calcium exchanger 4-like [Cotesia glomerata]KAH0535836.1 hypothetical protein KQX54_019628 [Cotesia glomerata]